MRTANPALDDRVFEAASVEGGRSNVMTVNGAVVKTGVLTALLVAAGGLAWTLVHPTDGSMAYDPAYRALFGIGAPIAAFIVALVTCFAPRVSPVTAPLYAALEGLFLGAVSSFFAVQYQGIVLQAALLTTGTLAVMLLAYSSGLIRATEKFKLGVIAATGAVCLVYLAAFVLRLFGVTEVYQGIFSAGPLGIGFSAVVVVIAALNLVLDFDVIETGARYGAPKYMEWYAAFGLLVTLVWLYLEILRLLSKLRSNND